MRSGSRWLTTLPALGIAFACSQTSRDFDPRSGPAESGAGADGGSDGEAGGESGDPGHADGGTSGSGEPEGGAAGAPGVDCEEGQFADGSECTDFTTCDVGEYVSKEGSEDADRECSECTDGYSTSENAPTCTEWATCSWQGGGYAEKGTRSTDAVCGTPSAYRQFGTDKLEFAYSMAVGSDGSVYVVGYTNGDLAEPDTGTYDAFVRKFDASGTVEWTDQIGSISAADPSYYSNENAVGIALDESGNAYIAGQTDGTLGEENVGGADVFVRKYAPSGDVLWTRQFGSVSTDIAGGIAVDGNGNAFVVGRTLGVLETEGAGTSYDAFLTKYDTNGNRGWTNQFGGSSADDSDAANAVAVDSKGNVYVAGVTSGLIAGEDSFGADDAFVKKFNALGGLVQETQFGTASYDSAYAVIVLDDDVLYVAGGTDGELEGTNAGGFDAYLKRFTTSTFTYPWTDQFGTDASDTATALALDQDGNVYVAGNTNGGLAGTYGNGDGFVRAYSSENAELDTTQFGSMALDTVRAVGLDASKNVYVAGDTKGDLQGPNLGGIPQDAFVLQLPPSSGTP